jgi:hypothetical protein
MSGMNEMDQHLGGEEEKHLSEVSQSIPGSP